MARTGLTAQIQQEGAAPPRARPANRLPTCLRSGVLITPAIVRRGPDHPVPVMVRQGQETASGPDHAVPVMVRQGPDHPSGGPPEPGLEQFLNPKAGFLDG